ncbi:MAG: hypothetical protein JO001_26615 [Alphaproteobacteria bacterium]|nr:hypothetical protein [Alphaproteobacteria bacterium]
MRRSLSRLTRRCWGARLAVTAAVLTPSLAQAGPPFRTDDPVPVETGHWEIYDFSAATHVTGDTAGALNGIDANYGAAENLQLHAALPMNLDKPDGGGVRAGIGDTELGFKYRFLTEDEAGWRPQAAIYPAIDFPTGNAARGLGTGRTHLFLPLWLQKTFGDWSSFAGLAYDINPGPGNRDYGFAGWVVQRQITEDLSLGAELFHQTANAVGGKGQTGFNLGLTYDLSAHYHLLFSAGEGLQNRVTTNAFSYYAALQFTF